MEIIIDNNRIKAVTGKMFKSCGYVLTRRTKRDGTIGLFASRNVPYNCFYSDCRHAQYIEFMANTVKNSAAIGFVGLQLTVREFIDARVSAVCGWPLSRFSEEQRKLMLKTWCNIITMRYRKVKPNTLLNADDVLRLKDLLHPKGINRI